MPHITTPSHHALDGSAGPINGWSDIQIEDRFACGLRRPRVVVDDIAHFPRRGSRGLPLHVPVVAIERRLSTSDLSTKLWKETEGNDIHPNLAG